MNYNSGACIVLVLGYVPLAPNSLCEVRCQKGNWFTLAVPKVACLNNVAIYGNRGLFYI